MNNIIANDITFKNNKNEFYASLNDSINAGDATATGSPGAGGAYTSEQDSAFNLDTKLSLPFLFWLKKSLDNSDTYWRDWMRILEMHPNNMLKESFVKMPANVFAPLPTEIVQHAISRQMALSVPTVSIFSENGINFNLRNIGLLLGLVEDVSPVITYTLAISADVEVVVYSISAKIVATIFKGTQRPGRYTFHWNGKDDAGKKMPSGDYIAEVKIGAERYVRKRIVIN